MSSIGRGRWPSHREVSTYSPAAATILRGMMPDVGEPTGFVFRSHKGAPYTSAGLRSILKRHGGFCPYALRHSFAQEALGQLSKEDVGKLLGHSDPRTTDICAQIRDRRAVAAARSIELKVG